ncbi:CaiB/BaiF CoA transferase family protein [Actinoplanes sp. NPDC051494]|uniref:CaiB/BaiF CoA transferase family protein n=1 Tax=Actinoplanes sp. NPDC051494 TaxID=3363907 RepID=UPI00379C025D
MGPLHGLTVVELAGIGPAPFAAMLLADLGADVIRVDRPGPPAAGRPAGPPPTAGRSAGPPPAADRPAGPAPQPARRPGPPSPLAIDPRHDLLNRGKRTIAADLKTPAGREIVLGLAGNADVLIEGFRPGVAERLGVGPADVHARNPRLVYGRMTGWGQDGPRSATAGHDITYLAVSGALHTIGRAGGPPQVPVNLLGDFAGGSLYLVVGLLAALRDPDRTGRVVDAAIVDGAAHLTTMLYGLSAAGAWQDERGLNLLDTGAPFYDVYEASDGGYLAVGALEPQFYAEFVRLLGVDGELPTQYDRAGWPVLRERFATAFRSRTRDEWAAVFEASDACVAPVLSRSEAVVDAHLAYRKTFGKRDGITQPAPAPRFGR